MKVGQKVSWYIRPEIQVEYGGYLEGELMHGTIDFVGAGFVMVRTDKTYFELTYSADTPKILRHHRYAVDVSNPSLKANGE